MGHLIANYQGGQQPGPGQVQRLGQGQRRWNDLRAGVSGEADDVVGVNRIRGPTVGKACAGGRRPFALEQDRCRIARPELGRHAGCDATARGQRARQAPTKAIHEAQFRLATDCGGQRFPARLAYEMRNDIQTGYVLNGHGFLLQAAGLGRLVRAQSRGRVIDDLVQGRNGGIWQRLRDMGSQDLKHSCVRPVPQGFATPF